MSELSTREKLLRIGKEEFLNKGYKDASLREIAKKAGFTLGAFYGYYGNKEALFDDILLSQQKNFMVTIMRSRKALAPYQRMCK